MPGEADAITDANGDYLRDQRGMFRPGTKGGPGAGPAARHAREIAAKFDAEVFKVFSSNRLNAALDSLLKKAEGGDSTAMRLCVEIAEGRGTSIEIEELRVAIGEIVATRGRITI
jgi:hypothetical protein